MALPIVDDKPNYGELMEGETYERPSKPDFVFNTSEEKAVTLRWVDTIYMEFLALAEDKNAWEDYVAGIRAEVESLPVWGSDNRDAEFFKRFET
jgi:hypothetical protein